MTTEALLIDILKDVIGITELNRDEHFLDIGGNSLNLIEVLKQIKERTGVTMAPRIFFDRSRSTIASISATIDLERDMSHSSLSAAD